MNLYKRIKQLIGKNGIRAICLILVAIIAFYLTGIEGSFFWTVFFLFLLFRIDSKYVGQAALVCLVTLPFLLALDKEAVAEQIAVYAYFLLVITVALQMVELKREPGETKQLEFIDRPMRQVAHILDLRMRRKHVLDLTNGSKNETSLKHDVY